MKSVRFYASGFALLTAFATFAPASVHAATFAVNDTNAAANPDQAQQTPAGKFIQNLGNQAIAVMADKSITQDQRMSKYRELLRSSFDMLTIGHFVLGRAWATATPDQQQRFMTLFSELVLRTYGDRLNFYNGEKFQVVSSRQESDSDSVVSSQITHPDGAAPTKIDWRVRQKGSNPAIIDVVVEGVSQSVTQRQEYSSILQRNNGNMDTLLDQMQQHLNQPAPASAGQ